MCKITSLPQNMDLVVDKEAVLPLFKYLQFLGLELQELLSFCNLCYIYRDKCYTKKIGFNYFG